MDESPPPLGSSPKNNTLLSQFTGSFRFMKLMTSYAGKTTSASSMLSCGKQGKIRSDRKQHKRHVFYTNTSVYLLPSIRARTYFYFGRIWF